MKLQRVFLISWDVQQFVISDSTRAFHSKLQQHETEAPDAAATLNMKQENFCLDSTIKYLVPQHEVV